MTVDLSDSVQKWRNHFQQMARGKIPQEDLYMMNQKGRGLGTGYRGRALYQIQSGGQGGISVIPSPSERGYAMAMGRIRNSRKKQTLTKKRKTKSTSRKKPIKRKTKSKKTSKVVKRGKRKTSPKSKPAKRKSTPKKKKKKTTIKKKVKDIFG